MYTFLQPDHVSQSSAFTFNLGRSFIYSFYPLSALTQDDAHWPRSGNRPATRVSPRTALLPPHPPKSPRHIQRAPLTRPIPTIHRHHRGEMAVLHALDMDFWVFSCHRLRAQHEEVALWGHASQRTWHCRLAGAGSIS